MININLNSLAKEDDGVKAICSKLVNEQLENQISSAFRHSYFVTEEQSEVLNDIFKPRHVFQRSNGRLLESSHPIFAVLNEYSNYDAHNNIVAWAAQGHSIMTIGDSTSQKLKAHHNCLLLNNTRDLFRVANNKGAEDVKRYAHGRISKPLSQCKEGSQNCYFKADKCVAVHSLYDVKFDDLAKIFINHDIDTLIAYIYIPLTLYDEKLDQFDTNGFRVYPHSTDKLKLVFTLDDFSTPYVHDKNTWMAYANTSKIVCPDFDIAIEHARTYGPLHVLNMQRVRSSIGVMPIVAPIASRMKGFYRVPDMVHAAMNSFRYRQSDAETQHFIVPAHIVDGVLAYALRAKDESYKYVEIAAVASGYRHQITIGSSVYRRAWDVHQNDYRDIVLSLFIIGAINRTDRTKTISQCFSELKTLSSLGYFGDKLKKASNYLNRFIHSNNKTDADGMGYFLNDWQVVRFKDKIYNNTHVYHDPTIAYYSSKERIPDDYIDTDVSLIGDFVTPLTSEDGQSVTSIDSNDTEITASLNIRLDDESTNIKSNDTELVKTVNINSDYIVFPRVFKSGHCAMKAFWDIMPRESKPKQSAMLKLCFEKLAETYDIKIVTAYIHEGEWDTDASSDVIPILSQHYNIPVEIVDGQNKTLAFYGDAPYKKIKYEGKHYSCIMRGGSIDKFKPIAFDLAGLITDGSSVHDVSAAPGYLINMIFDQCMDMDIYPKFYASVYKGIDSALFTQCADGITIQNYNTSYGSNFPDKKFDLLINDAARDVNTEELTEYFCSYAKRRLNLGGHVLTKTFADPHYVYELATYFKSYTVIPGVGTERYFLLVGYHPDKNYRTFEAVYDAHHVALTSHTIVTNRRLLESFKRGFFRDMSKFDPKIKELNCRASIQAYTGYASSSKTTKLIERYPDAIFVSPTKELSLRHQNLGVRSYTQHAIFTAKVKSGQTIIVDELSQFCAEYAILLKLTFPTSNIILCGDIEQTPFSNYFDTSTYTTFDKLGIRNNIIDVYKIPIDIANLLNKKFGWHIRTHSEVEISVYKLSSLIDIAKCGIKTICYNNTTYEELKSKGVNVSTVTTYTGSRTTDVILYVDGAAVLSNFVNNTAVTYTALTRTTKRLFLYGETQSVERFYNFNATLISTYEEFSQLISHDEVFVKDAVVLPMQSVNDKVADDTSSQDIAENIVSEIIRPSNTDTGVHAYNQICDVSPIQDGLLKTNEEQITPQDRDIIVHRVSNVESVINQVSDSTLATIQTMAKRYARGYKIKSRNKRETNFTYSALMNGLCKALTGNSRNINKIINGFRTTKEELLKNAFAYYESLDEKMKEQCCTSDEITTMFEPDQDGTLSFFNKRQTKWSPKNGFDATDKVGQGVAAFSKKVNIMYAAYARTMLDKAKAIIQHSNRRILLATHHSEAQINDIYLDLIKNSEHMPYTCNDFSEWDSSFRSPFIKMTSTLLRFMGMPEHAVTWFEDIRFDWKMIYRNAFGNTILRGHEKQFSGNPFTICENTLGNLALCFALFDYQDFQYGLFKGDDSAVCCRRCVLLPEARKILNYTSHGLKLHNSNIGEFAGWVLTNKGIFPDVLRYTAKFLSKNYRDEKHFSEALQSVQERCSAVKTETQLYEGCVILAEFYKQTFMTNNITHDQMRLLFHFLKESRNMRFNDLLVISKQVNIISRAS